MQPMTQTNLDELKAKFDELRQKWLSEGRDGQWALIHKEASVEFFRSYDAAVMQAVNSYDSKDCLVQQVLAVDQTDTIQHVYWSA